MCRVNRYNNSSSNNNNKSSSSILIYASDNVKSIYMCVCVCVVYIYIYIYIAIVPLASRQYYYACCRNFFVSRTGNTAVILEVEYLQAVSKVDAPADITGIKMRSVTLPVFLPHPQLCYIFSSNASRMASACTKLQLGSAPKGKWTNAFLVEIIPTSLYSFHLELGWNTCSLGLWTMSIVPEF
jgi:hypothetical protein